MGVQAAKAYLNRIREARAEKGPVSVEEVVIDSQAEPDEQITHLLTVSQALGVDLRAFTALLIDPADNGDAQVAAVFQAEHVVRRRTHPLMRQSRAIYITERDLDMLQSLALGRTLSAEMLERFHFTWPTRSIISDEQTQHDSTARNSPSIALYTRLIALCVLGYVQRSTHSIGMPHMYALTQAGSDLLRHQRGISADALWVEDIDSPSDEHLLKAQMYA